MHAITEAVTGAIGDYGLYAVFILMFVDAVLPAASELVMVYGGAVAVGAFPGSEVTLFGSEIESTAWAYFAIAMAGTIGYTLGSIAGWAIGLYGGRPYLERHGRWLHVDQEKLDRVHAWFERYGDVTVLVTRMLPVVRSFVSIPAGIAEMPFVRYTVLHLRRDDPVVLRAGRRSASRSEASGSGSTRPSATPTTRSSALVVAGVGALAYRTYRRRARKRAVEERSAEGTGG